MATPTQEVSRTIMIQSGDESIVFHVWEDVQITEEMEMTDKPTVSGGRDQEVIRPLPPEFTFTVKASDEITVPVVKGDAVNQDDMSMIEQVDKLRSLKGQEITVTSGRLDQEVDGLVRRVQVIDDGQFDNVTRVTVTVQSFARSLTAEGTTFGEEIHATLDIPPRKDPSQPKEESEIPAAGNIKNALPMSGECVVTKVQSEPKSVSASFIESAVNHFRTSPTGLGLESGFRALSTGISELNEIGESKQSHPVSSSSQFALHSNGEIEINNKRLSTSKFFSQIVEAKNNDGWINVDREVKNLRGEFIPKDEAKRGEQVPTPTIENFTPELIKARILKYIPKENGGTGQALGFPDSSDREALQVARGDKELKPINPLPSGMYTFVRGDRAPSDLREPIKGDAPEGGFVTETPEGNVTINGEWSLLVHPLIFIIFASRVFEDSVANAVDQLEYGEC